MQHLEGSGARRPIYRTHSS